VSECRTGREDTAQSDAPALARALRAVGTAAAVLTFVWPILLSLASVAACVAAAVTGSHNVSAAFLVGSTLASALNALITAADLGIFFAFVWFFARYFAAVVDKRARRSPAV
jgi:hypothetical protein